MTRQDCPQPSVTQQLGEGNEVVRKEFIKQLLTEPIVTYRTGPKMWIQRLSGRTKQVRGKDRKTPSSRGERQGQERK